MTQLSSCVWVLIMRRFGDTISFLPLLSMVVLFLRWDGYQKAFDNLLEVR